MKTAIKVFEIIALVVAALCGVLCLVLIICIAAGSAEVAKQFEAMGLTAGVAIAYYVVILIFEVLRIVLTVFSIKRVNKPIEKRPVALGILNIFFGSFIGGILLLCLSPENA